MSELFDFWGKKDERADIPTPHGNCGRQDCGWHGQSRIKFPAVWDRGVGERGRNSVPSPLPPQRVAQGTGIFIGQQWPPVMFFLSMTRPARPSKAETPMDWDAIRDSAPRNRRGPPDSPSEG